MTAVDCNPNGSRSCDATQPGGYCTIQGCDELSCPEEAVCMRYFPAQFLTKPCRPHDHVVDPNAPTDPNASIDPNAPTGCDADEVCLDAGLCAPLSTELRYCVKSCASVDDCREGYECRLAGTRGSMALTRNPDRRREFLRAAVRTPKPARAAADNRACAVGMACSSPA